MSVPEKEHPVWKLLQDLVSYIPVVVVLLMITNKWDGEYLLLAALAAGAGGKQVISQLLSKGSDS